jgi:DNA-binding winged helix-turn-helix (wHTH) protein/tetratricopeptide (TPR) repeat protein
VTVDPSTRRINGDGRSQTLEPRVMRVLVALGEQPARVLSRDELIELCWDGRLVTDNAITRVISLLRHALDDLSRGAVKIETITKVGFRLVVNGQAASAEPGGCAHSGGSQPATVAMDGTNVAVWRRAWTRRAALVGLAGAAIAATSLARLRSSRYTPNPRAVELYRRGQAIQKAGELESMGEAVEAYKQAVAIDPRYADAWGALALSYRYPVAGGIARLGDPQEVRAAARRALALDPGNVDARLALITLYPVYRRWQEREAQLRAFLRDHPDSALGHLKLGNLLFNVGRIEDALTEANQSIGIDPTREIAWVLLAFTYYYAGRDDEGDIAIDDARSRWPQSWRLYVNGYFFLLFSKRYNEAIAYLRDTSRRPRKLSREMVENWIQEADAFASGRPFADEVRMAHQPAFQSAALEIQAPEFAAPDLALLGKVDEMFNFFEAFFFGGVFKGTRVAPPGPLDSRSSSFLFAPVVLSLRNDPRFASLLARTGLEDYWHKTGTPPDFRLG